MVERKTVVIEELQVSDSSIEDTQALEPTTETIITEHIIARKPVHAPAPAPIAASNTIKAIPPQHQDDDLELITPLSTNDTSTETSLPPPPVLVPTEEEAASPVPTEPKPSKKQAPLFSALNHKFHNFSFHSDRKEKEATSVSVSVTEIEIAVPGDDQGPKTGIVDNDDGIVNGGV